MMATMDIATTQAERRTRRKPKQKAENPIVAAVHAWLAGLTPAPASSAELVASTPKRWVVYDPMVLLPSGSFSSQEWIDLFNLISEEKAAVLWRTILARIAHANHATHSRPLTHLAVNEGIPLRLSPRDETSTKQQDENILRSPTNLRPLHGNFGPPPSSTIPTPADFTSAFWVSTRQHSLYQTWAPLYTMFSRGNIEEKARLMTFPRAASASTLVVDLYAGIGYFVFAYARLGFRVLCWELNPWSVEGLRRGAEKNGWSVKVVQGRELEGAVELGDERIVVFVEDNERAEKRIADMRAKGEGVPVEHVNCGFLPTSEPTWKGALEIVRGEGGEKNGREVWLHLHENVGVGDIDVRRDVIQELFDGWSNVQSEGNRAAEVTHVERVKTFAPGVWHCVFDVRISSVVQL